MLWKRIRIVSMTDNIQLMKNICHCIIFPRIHPFNIRQLSFLNIFLFTLHDRGHFKSALLLNIQIELIQD